MSRSDTLLQIFYYIMDFAAKVIKVVEVCRIINEVMKIREKCKKIVLRLGICTPRLQIIHHKKIQL